MWWNEKYSSARRRQNDISCLYTFQRKEESSLPLEYHQSATRELHNVSKSRSLLHTFYSAFLLFVFLPSSRKVSIQSPFLIFSGLLLELFLFFLPLPSCPFFLLLLYDAKCRRMRVYYIVPYISFRLFLYLCLYIFSALSLLSSGA